MYRVALQEDFAREMGQTNKRRDALGKGLSALRAAFPRKSVSFQARAQGDVGDDVSACAALDGDPGGFGSHSSCSNDDSWDLHQMRHLLRLQSKQEGKTAVNELQRKQLQIALQSVQSQMQ